MGGDIDGEAAGDGFGVSLALSLDGKTLAIGAQNNDGNGNESGHVRVFQYEFGTWKQVGADLDGEAAGDLFGGAISLSADGGILAVGATNNDGNGNESGHVRAYKNEGGTWIKLGEDLDGEAAGDLSGGVISLSADGKYLAIGATGNDDNGNVQ